MEQCEQSFQFEPELAFLDLVNDIFIDTSTPTHNINLLDFSQTSEYFFDAVNISRSSTSFLAPNICKPYPNRFRINDYVCINEKKHGYVKFQGRVHFAEGYFCGIELEDQDGKHDGKIDNIRYVTS